MPDVRFWGVGRFGVLRSALAAGVVAGVSSCATPDGLWLMQVNVVDATCESDGLSHNFVDAQPAAEEESDLASEDRETLSDELFFAEVLYGPDGTGVLVIGEEAYPGVLETDTWTFTWTNTENATHTEAFQQDYYYEEALAEERTTTVTMSIGDTTASGTITLVTTSSTAWYETDVWDSEATTVETGQIPAADMLVLEDEEGGETAASNAADSEDCLSGTCEMRSESTCTSRRPFVATWVSVESDGSKTNVADSGQAAGT